MSGGAFSRNKGATLEREVAAALRDHTGVKFERNLEQYRKETQGDLIADDPAWPFVIECKRAASPGGRMMQWRRQTMEAAQAAGKMPALIYRYDRGPMRAAIPLPVVMGKAAWSEADEWADIAIIGFAYVAAEIMAAPRVIQPHYTPENAPDDPTPDEDDTDGVFA